MAESDDSSLASLKKIAEQLLHAKRLPEARSAYEQLCQQNPNDFDVWLNFGVINGRLGLFDVAEAAFKKALTLRNDVPHIYINLARLCELQGRFDEMLGHCRNYLRLKPDDADAYSKMSWLLHEMGRLAEAEQARCEAVRCYNNSGLALFELGRFDEALNCYQAALQLNPKSVEVHCNLGNLYHRRGDDELAEFSYATALEIHPSNADVHMNLGCFYLDSGRPDEAMDHFKEALRIDSNRADAHWYISWLLLLSGNFSDGWKEYEYRFKDLNIRGQELGARYTSKPLWDGSPLSGQTLLVYAEQGFGDTLQFCRYLPLVRQRVEHVVFECQPDLYRLLSGMFDGIELIERRKGSQAPEAGYDLQIPLMSLPRLFETGIDTIPQNTPYIHANPLLVEQWRNRLNCNEFKVGVVWAGNPTYKGDQKRSLSLTSFAPFGQLQQISFYSLQKGPAAAEVVAPPAGMKLIDLSLELNDFATTAAVVANLDLVITVDTAVAHLAGAMGKPVWALIYSPPDWRWLLDRDDSPWYPTMRLFRQRAPGEWGPVIEIVAEELRKECSRRVVYS